MGPILDMMGMVLENIPASIVAARTMIAVVYRTAQIVSCIPNVSYYRKVTRICCRAPDTWFFNFYVLQMV